MKKSIKYFAIAIVLITGIASAQDFERIWEKRMVAAGVSPDTIGIGLLIYKNPPILRVVAIREDLSYKVVHEYPVCAIDATPGQKLRLGDGKTFEGYYYVRKYNLGIYGARMRVEYPEPTNPTLSRVKDTLVGDIFIHGGCVSDDGSIAIGDGPAAELYWLLENHSQIGTRTLILPFEDDQEYYDRLDSMVGEPPSFKSLRFMRTLNACVLFREFPWVEKRGYGVNYYHAFSADEFAFIFHFLNDIARASHEDDEIPEVP